MKRTVEFVILAVIVVGGFLLRTLPQLGTIFVNGNVLYREVDTWYHMRLADVVANGGPFLRWDMYSAYPHGSRVGFFPLLSWLVQLGGNFMDYEVWAAWIAPVFGALSLIVVFFLGRLLWGRLAGLLSTGILAILPGEFFHRTMLGYPDHHFLECFFLPLTMLFILLGKRSWKWSLAAGVSLGLYTLSWQGSSLLILIIFIYYWYEFTRGREGSWKNTCLMGLIGLGIYLPSSYYSTSSYQTVLGYGVLILVPLICEFLRRHLKKENLLFLLTFSIPILIVVADLTYKRFSGSIYSIYEGFFSVFGGFGSYIAEAAPPSVDVYLATMGVCFLLSLGGLIVYLKSKPNALIVIWSIIIMLAAMSQRRWGYYSALNVALLSAFFITWVVQYVESKTKGVVVGIFCVFIIATTFVNTAILAKSPNDISNSWYSSMLWLKDNSPEPFPLGEDYYYNSSTKEPPSYGVLSWWDYGHYILRIARRVPVDSPTHADVIPAEYLCAPTEEAAEQILKEANYDIKYIVLDDAVLTSKFRAVVERAGYNVADTDRMRLNCEAYRIWTNRSPIWKLIHEEGEVRIYERVTS